MTAAQLRPGWRKVKFGDVVRQVKDKVDPETAGIERYVAGEHMDTDDLRIRRWGELGDGYLGPAFTMRFKPGQVLYGSRRTYLRKVALADFEGICANTTFVIESATDDLLPEFLPYVMTTEAFHGHSIKQSKGSVNPYINFSDLKWYEFALPPLDEQKRIVEVLAAVDDTIARYGEAESRSHHLEQALVVEAASTGRTTTLGELASNGGIQIGPFGSQLHAHEYTDEGVPVVMPSDMTPGGLRTENLRRVSAATAQRLQNHRVQPGDILLPRRGDLDKRALVTEHEQGWLCGTGSVRVRLDDPEAAPLAVRLLAGSDTVRWLGANAVGTTMPNLNAAIVSRVPLSMPPPLQRHAYAARLQALSEFRDEARAARSAAADARRTVLGALLEAGVQ